VLLDDVALYGLGAAADFFACYRQVGAVFRVAWAEVGWYAQKPECVGDGEVDACVDCGYVFAEVLCACGCAVGDFACLVVVDGSAAAGSAD